MRSIAPLLLCVASSLAWSPGARGAVDDAVPRWPDLGAEVAEPGGGGGDDAAVVVGVGTYVYLPPIAGAVDNAHAWQQWLLHTRKVRPERVVLLTDREATKERIEKNLKAMAGSVGPQGTLWFVFIGHGAPSSSGDDGLVLGVDTDANPESIASRGLSQQAVLAALAASRSAHPVAVFDACFSGRTSDGGQPLVDGLQATPPNRRAPPPRAPTTVLAASDTFAGPLPGAGRPAFSYLLLGALRGWADEDGDRRVTVEEAHGFTRATIQALFKSDERLPRRTGPPAELARDAGEARPDLAALLVGRCPAHSRWTGRACKARPAVKCPEGTSWNGEACASECPTGTVWDGNGCAAQRVVCADGATWDGRACVGACPAGTRWRDGACVGDAPAPTTAAARPLTAEERAIVTSVAREWDTNLFKRRWVQKKSLQLLTTELQSLTSLVEATPTTNPDRIKYLLRVGAGWGEYAVAAERELRESRAANNAERAATSRKKLEAACRQGLKVLERAVAQDPQSFDGWKALGWAERLPVLLGVSEGTAAAEATGRAIAAWQNALRLRHSDAPVLLLLASAERDAGRPQQARSSLEKAAAIAPDEPDIAVLRALFALEDGQRARARKFLGLPWWRSPPPVAEPLEPLLR